MALAIRSGIAPDVWRNQDPADLMTAFDLLEEESNELEED